MLNALDKELLLVLRSIDQQLTVGIASEPIPEFWHLRNPTKTHDDLPNGLRTTGHISMAFARESARQAIQRLESAAADHPQGEAIRKLATELWDDDECTVDHDAALAEACEDGAVWVQCWQLLDADTLRENGITTEGMANNEDGQDRESYSDNQDREAYS